jgi:hypothetical protein
VSRRSLPPSIRVVPPARVAFWSGAGISSDPPTQGPVGLTLTKRALKYAFTPAFTTRVMCAYEALGIARELPRLESVLDVAAAEHGIQVLADLLADLEDPPPNPNHTFFASHLAAGGRHVTANFDTCIERAGGDPTGIVHFHGHIANGDWGSLGARLSRIEGGFPGEVEAQLDGVLDACRAIIVVGYSGLDYFDVDPYWRSVNKRGAMTGKSVLWIDHRDCGWDLSEDPAVTRRQLAWFADGGATIYELHAPTRDVLAELANVWSLPAPDGTSDWEDRPEPSLYLDPRIRERATTRFLAAMGLHDAVRQRLAGKTLGEEDHEWAAAAAWTAGQYRESARHWAQARPGSDPVSTAHRAERHAAALWLRGELRRGRRELIRALDEAALTGVPAEQRLAMAETLGRVVEHMARLPDTKLFVTRKRSQQALGYLDGATQSLSTATGVHMKARVSTVRAALTGQPPDRSPEEPVRDFDESEALLAMLNYRHAALRARAALRDGRPSAAEYHSHREAFRHIGDLGDAARVPLLPGAETAFSPASVWRGFADVDFTNWHRFRLFATWLLRKSAGDVRARLEGINSGRSRSVSEKD